MSEPIVLNPQIKTERLLLRAPTPTDAAPIAALFANPANMKFEPHAPTNATPSEYASRITKWEASRLAGTACFMAIARPGTGAGTRTGAEDAGVGAVGPDDTIIGFGGINAIITDAQTGRRTADVGVLIDSSECGNGFGREALRATLRYAFDQAAADEVLMETLAVNVTFQRVMDGLGLGEFKKSAQGSFGPEAVYRFGRDEWRRAMAASA